MGKVLLIVGIILILIGGIVSLVNYLSLQNNIEGLKSRAQVSADADEIHNRLVDLDQAMEERGMTSGYASLWVHSPWTSVKEIRQNVKRIIERADVISKLDHSSDAYQQGLDDVRGTLRELDLQAWGWWLYNSAGWVFLYLLIGLGIVLLILAFIYWER